MSLFELPTLPQAFVITGTSKGRPRFTDRRSDEREERGGGESNASMPFSRKQRQREITLDICRDKKTTTFLQFSIVSDKVLYRKARVHRGARRRLRGAGAALRSLIAVSFDVSISASESDLLGATVYSSRNLCKGICDNDAGVSSKGSRCDVVHGSDLAPVRKATS